MAKRRSSSRALVRNFSAPRPVILRVPAAIKRHVRKRGGGQARTEKHRVGTIIGGALLGYIDKQGFQVPELPIIGKAGTLGVAAWAYARSTGSRWADDAATGMLTIAAYEFMREGSIAGVQGDPPDPGF